MGVTVIVVWLVDGIYGCDYYSGVASGWNLWADYYSGVASGWDLWGDCYSGVASGWNLWA